MNFEHTHIGFSTFIEPTLLSINPKEEPLQYDHNRWVIFATSKNGSTYYWPIKDLLPLTDLAKILYL